MIEPNTTDQRLIDFRAGRFPDPDPAEFARVLQDVKLSLGNWLALRERPVIFWGWAPEDLNTMCFEHESLRRAFHFMGFRTAWFSSKEDAASALAKFSSPRIYVTGNGAIGEKLLPHIHPDDVVIVHNEFDIARWRCRVFPYGQYCLPSTCYPGATLPYPSDFLPHEYNAVCLDKKLDDLAMFVGSPYSPAFLQQQEEIKQVLEKRGFSYGFVETWNPTLVQQCYVSARWMPVPQLPEMITFLPSRFCKGMARACIPVTVNPVIPVLMGWGAEACVVGADWEDAARQMSELRVRPELLRKKSLLALEWAKGLTALHFLEYLWPRDEREASETYWLIQQSVARGNDLIVSRGQLEMLLRRYPGNRVVLALLGSVYKGLGLRQEQTKIYEILKSRDPSDVLLSRVAPS